MDGKRTQNRCAQIGTTAEGQEYRLPRLVIGAPHGRSGKSTITVGLIGALREQGFAVQPFKKGPDFIDPSWLSLIAGRPCRNLDRFWMTPAEVTQAFVSGSHDADIGIVEGAMGLYDGMDIAGTGSTAEIAKTLKAPVLLVVDTTRMTRSVAALVMGFQQFDRGVDIAGVILNKVVRRRHERMLRQAIEEYCGIPVVGTVPKDSFPPFPERHLGLVPAAEYSVETAVAHTTRVIRETVNLKRVMAIARTAPPLVAPERVIRPENLACERVRIGVVMDACFTFYYPENLEALTDQGAELVMINALTDRDLPDVDALYIGGGFPEVFAQALEANGSLRRAVREAVEAFLPVYAECGGLMYLGQSIIWDNNRFQMVGALPFDVVMEKRPQGHGYTVMEVAGENPVFSPGTVLKGHEFHHSRIVNAHHPLQFAFRVKRGYGIDGENDGIVHKNTLAAYNHIHALAQPEWAAGLVAKAREYKRRHAASGV